MLVTELGSFTGGRVLLRSPNNPLMAAALFAVMKAGGIAVTSMPLLRAKELAFMSDKARVALALCDHRFLEELEKAGQSSSGLARIVPVGGGIETRILTRRIETSISDFAPCPTAAEDICLIAFTSGTTGVPKGAMHNHRDMLATCDTYGKMCSSPRLGCVHRLAAARLHLRARRRGAVLASGRRLVHSSGAGGARQADRGDSDAEADRLFHGADRLPGHARENSAGQTWRACAICVSAGEALPRATWEAWQKATGIEILDGIGSTEMLHIFIGAPAGKIKPGATGIPVPGYEAKIVDEEGRELPRGSVGLLAVRGPTGCRYLADPRQTVYVRDGWNFTGDTYRLDEDGYYWHQARSDDMIVSAGYNIAGPEVEGALLSHPSVLECAVVGAPRSRP